MEVQDATFISDILVSPCITRILRLEKINMLVISPTYAKIGVSGIPDSENRGSDGGNKLSDNGCWCLQCIWYTSPWLLRVSVVHILKQ